MLPLCQALVYFHVNILYNALVSAKASLSTLAITSAQFCRNSIETGQARSFFSTTFRYKVCSLKSTFGATASDILFL